MPTFYLNADTGDDTTGDGSEGNPWQTLSKGITTAADDDTLILQKSATEATEIIYDFPSVTWSKGLTLTGEMDADNIVRVVVDNADAGVQWIGMEDLTMSNILFRNAKVNAAAGSIGKPMFQTVSSQNLTWSITNCIFRNLGVAGGTAVSGLMGTSAGFGSTNWTNTLTNCLFDELFVPVTEDSTAASVFGARQIGIHTLTMTNCTFFSSKTGTDALANINFYNAFVTDGNISVKNCIFRASGDSIEWVKLATALTTNAAVNTCFNNIDNPPSDSTNITDDPLFVDETNGVFDLRPSSPCIDTGIIL